MLAGLPGHITCPDPSLYWSDNYVVLDFETTSHTKGSPLDDANNIVLSVWGLGAAHPDRPAQDSSRREQDTLVREVRWCGEYELGDLVRAVERADFLIAHNAKFELGWLKRCGLDLRKTVVFDTMLAEYVIGGNRYNLFELSLNACLNRRGLEPKEDTVAKMIKNGVPMDMVPESWLLKYCIRDVEACHELFLAQRSQLRELGLEAVNYQRNLVAPCLADIEFNGMQLDNQAVLDLEEELERKYIQKTDELQSICEGASPSSTKQMREYIYGVLGFAVPKDFRGNPHVTPSGEPSTAAEVMGKLVARTKRQKEFLSVYNEWSTLHSHLTKYIRKFGACVRNDAGVLRGNFNQCTTRTHRFSSSGVRHRVQFQNFNRDFKPLFTSRNDGWYVGEADGAQLEFRIAAHLGRDSLALHDIVEGVDVHSFTASIIGTDRTSAKRHTFKPLYGGSSGTDAERKYYEAFKEKYRGIAETQQGWTRQVLKHKYLVTEYGLRYYWPDTKMTASGWITNTTSIYNYPVQGFATAEIIPLALVCAWHRMEGLQSFLVNTVHDSIIAEVHPDEVDEWHEVAKQCLIADCYKVLKDLYGIALTVPLGAGVKLGTHWAVGDEVKYEAPKELWIEAARQENMYE